MLARKDLQESHVGLAWILVERVADMSVKTDYRSTGLHLALENRHVGLARILAAFFPHLPS